MSIEVSVSSVPRLEVALEIDRIADALRSYGRSTRKVGAVVAVSGGIDSAVTLGLTAKALGPERVCALLLPDSESDGESTRLGRVVCATFGVSPIEYDITPVLDALDVYEERAAAIRAVVPAFQSDWPHKLVRSNVVEQDLASFYFVEGTNPRGETFKARLDHASFARIYAVMNYKQRVRKMIEYRYADERNYFVAGTPNRLEYDQGFFVRSGDGLADFKPIAHLYKSHVYQLATAIGVPAAIVHRRPTTDTFSLDQSQDEYFFGVPIDAFEQCLHGKDAGLSARAIADGTGLSTEAVERVFHDIERKRRNARYLESPCMTVPMVERLLEEEVR